MKKLKGADKRRFILLNPSWRMTPVEITERGAINQIQKNIDSGKCNSGDEMVVITDSIMPLYLKIESIEGKTVNLKLQSLSEKLLKGEK